MSTALAFPDDDLPAGQALRDTQVFVAGGDPNSEQATTTARSIVEPPARILHPVADQRGVDAQRSTVGDGDPAPPAPAKRGSPPNEAAPVLADPLLTLAADVLDDLEAVRIANENRLRQLTRIEADADGKERGFGLPLDHPDVARLAALVDALVKAEHNAQLNLERMMRRHPLGPWVKATRGVGEKQAARLLAAIGDPYWNTLHNRPRTVSELWAYAGYHVLRTGQGAADSQTRNAGSGSTGGNLDQRSGEPQRASVGVAATRVRGQRANWSATAKMRAHLVAVSIVKAGGPYREVYDAARAKYEDAVHHVECRRCGPSGEPAQPGSPLSAGHQHARALRAVAKAVLRDLWREAKRLHETAPPPNQES